MPIVNAYFETVVHHGKVYMIGGRAPDGKIKETWRFNTRTGKWKCLAGMLKPAASFAATRCGNYIYAFGGEKEGDYKSADVERYSIETNTWTAHTKMSLGMLDPVAFTLPGDRYIMVMCAQSNIYDTQQDSWHLIDAFNSSTSKSGTSVVRWI